MTGISRIAVVAGLGINCCAYAQGFTDLADERNIGTIQFIKNICHLVQIYFAFIENSKNMTRVIQTEFEKNNCLKLKIM
ncbi:hypothetical protein BpHYR1_018958 [Brachionus plicatilis]|uniref:Uncharacterized protein n=1 Tax=Brachionus plicatilis TaxID=10195 RepID=A0A3M7QP19_BRAPC|nr:hypothetical protein BpHYR1_018958 [Brachionus plicatilis]